MDMGKIETELSKVTKVKQGKQERQDYLEKLVEAAADLKDADWDDLSKKAQEWLNAGTKAFQAKKEISEFSDTPKADDDRPARERPARRGAAAEEAEGADEGADAEGEKDDDRPARRGRGSDDKDEDRPSRRGGDKGKDKDEAEAPARRGAAKDKDEPAPRKGADKDKDKGKDKEKEPARAARDKPAPKKTEAEPKGAGVKDRIKDLLSENPGFSVDELVKKLGTKAGAVSKITVSNIRAEWRHTIKNLQRGKVNVGKLEL